MHDYFMYGVGNPFHPANRCDCEFPPIDHLKDLIEGLENMMGDVTVPEEIRDKFYTTFYELVLWKENN